MRSPTWAARSRKVAIQEWLVDVVVVRVAEHHLVFPPDDLLVIAPARLGDGLEEHSEQWSRRGRYVERAGGLEDPRRHCHETAQQLGQICSPVVVDGERPLGLSDVLDAIRRVGPED